MIDEIVKMRLMGDLKDPRLMGLKAVLFVVAGTVSAGLILLESPRMQTAFLLAVAIWSFARAYYFAFYVVEHYIDGQYRFAGLVDFARYMASKASPHAASTPPTSATEPASATHPAPATHPASTPRPAPGAPGGSRPPTLPEDSPR